MGDAEGKGGGSGGSGGRLFQWTWPPSKDDMRNLGVPAAMTGTAAGAFGFFAESPSEKILSKQTTPTPHPKKTTILSHTRSLSENWPPVLRDTQQRFMERKHTPLI